MMVLLGFEAAALSEKKLTQGTSALQQWRPADIDRVIMHIIEIVFAAGTHHGWLPCPSAFSSIA